MLIMMNLHSRSINVRFQRLKRIIQIRHRVRIGSHGNGEGGSDGFLEEITTGGW
jgi:hypothetical protein